MTKVALITGITGQDGSYLAELLLEKGYEVHGIIRRSSSFNTGRIDHIFDDLRLHYGDMSDGSGLQAILASNRPDEVYHLAAQSHVKVSFEMPEYTAMVDGLGTLKLLQAAKNLDMVSDNKWSSIRFYNACTSEMYGSHPPPQHELTPMWPSSPYGVAKLYSYWIVRNYRDSYGMHASNGILFNHESPRRGATFVTQKVVQAAVRIKYGQQKYLKLGNLDAMRDWGHAKDYVEAMWLMLQQDEPDDYVIATGEMYSVRQLVFYAFQKLGMRVEWKNEVGIVDGKPTIYQDPAYQRPKDVGALCGIADKARNKLGWKPKYDFHTMLEEMIESEERSVKDKLSTSS